MHIREWGPLSKILLVAMPIRVKSNLKLTCVPTEKERFTHETEKDKTENVFLGMTKLGKTKLGIRFAENLFYEIPTFMAKTRISKYEKFKN